MCLCQSQTEQVWISGPVLAPSEHLSTTVPISLESSQVLASQLQCYYNKSHVSIFILAHTCIHVGLVRLSSDKNGKSQAEATGSTLTEGGSSRVNIISRQSLFIVITPCTEYDSATMCYYHNPPICPQKTTFAPSTNYSNSGYSIFCPNNDHCGPPSYK